MEFLKCRNDFGVFKLYYFKISEVENYLVVKGFDKCIYGFLISYFNFF